MVIVPVYCGILQMISMQNISIIQLQNIQGKNKGICYKRTSFSNGNGEENKEMYVYHFREWLTFFYFYCMAGWCFESVYVSLRQGRWTNRGFMRGPWLPIYGSGAICVLWSTLPVQGNPLLVYIVGAAAATVLEYFTGVFMVKLFHVRYWDYSYRKIQFQGHICLHSTVAWGFLSLAMVYGIHKPVEQFIFLWNEEWMSIITFLLTVVIVYDFANAFRQAMDLKKLIIQAEKLKIKMEEKWQQHRDELEKWKEYQEELKEQFKKEILETENNMQQLWHRMEGLSRHLLLQNSRSLIVGFKDETKLLREKISSYTKGKRD